jgi:hypothetical protein
MDFIPWITEGKRFLIASIPLLAFGYLLWYAIFESQEENQEEE